MAIEPWRMLVGLLVALLTLVASPGWAQGDEWYEVSKAGLRAADEGRFGDAEGLFREALAAERRVQREPIRAAPPASTISPTSCTPRASYLAAEPHYRESLAMREGALGPDHPDVAQSCNNLAELYRVLGRYDEAEQPASARARDPREGVRREASRGRPDAQQSGRAVRQPGPLRGGRAALPARARDPHGVLRRGPPDHRRDPPEPGHPVLCAGRATTRRSRSISRRWRSSRRRSVPSIRRSPRRSPTSPSCTASRASVDEAIELHRRALAIREKSLGANHPETAQSLNNLAVAHFAKGDYATAEELYRRSIAIKEAALGADHPELALTLNNLAELYRTQRRFDEAEPLYMRALAIDEESLGPDHPSLALGLNNLALLHYDRGAYVKAEPLLRRALSIEESSLGPEHPSW